MKRTATLLLLLLVIASASLAAESIRIVAPYLGIVTSRWDNPLGRAAVGAGIELIRLDQGSTSYHLGGIVFAF